MGREPTTCCGLFRRDADTNGGMEPDTGFRYLECKRDAGCRAGETAFWERHRKAGCPSPQSFQIQRCGTPTFPCNIKEKTKCSDCTAQRVHKKRAERVTFTVPELNQFKSAR